MLLLEFNNKDKDYIKLHSNDFTIALEFELETDDMESSDDSVSPAKFIEIAKGNAYQYIKDEGKSNKNMFYLVDEIIDTLDFEDVDENIDLFEEYLDEYPKGFANKLIQVLQADYMTYMISDNIDYLIENFKRNLPNFYKKWNSEIKFELDNTLKRGIEFSMNTYLVGIEDTIELIEDFYKDYNNQKYWFMNERTGIHINIGFTKKVDWNIIKGILMISDYGETAFTFKNMKWRQKSFYTNSILPVLKKELDSSKIMKATSFSDIKSTEDELSNYVLKLMNEFGYKNFGFNVTRISGYNYVEFRYPGGDIPKDVLIDKLYYFCYVATLMTDKNFKRREYLKKLYKFISDTVTL